MVWTTDAVAIGITGPNDRLSAGNDTQLGEGWEVPGVTIRSRAGELDEVSDAADRSFYRRGNAWPVSFS